VVKESVGGGTVIPLEGHDHVCMYYALNLFTNRTVTIEFL